MILVVSVHADDGLYSCGEFVANQVAHGEEVKVLSICSATLSQLPQADHDWQMRLNEEHKAACRSLGAQASFFEAVDGKWLPMERQAATVIHSLMGAFQHHQPSAALIPLGIRHPDHLAVAGFAREAAALARWDGRLAIYEDLPYRVLYPEEAAERRAWLVEGGGTLESAANGGYYDQKLAACQEYRSQWGDDARRCVMAPERIWWLR